MNKVIYQNRTESMGTDKLINQFIVVATSLAYEAWRESALLNRGFFLNHDT